MALGNRWHIGYGAMGVWARHRRFARNEAQRNDVSPSPPLISSSGGASGVAQGVQRDVPGERGFLGARAGARQDSPARLSHNASFASVAGPSGHVGPHRAESARPRRGLHAGRRGPGDRVASPGSLTPGRQPTANECCAKVTVLHSLCHAGAKPIHSVAVTGSRGRAVPTSDGRERRGPSPGGRRAGVRPAARAERQRSD